jgi:peptide/nickel transport system substrate-binding protein
MEPTYWHRQRMRRRDAFRAAGLGVAGLAGAALIGCGGGSSSTSTGGAATVPAGQLVGTAAATATQAAAATPVPKDQVRLKPGIFEGAVAPSPAEANPMVNGKRGGTLLMRYLDPPRMDLNRTLSCTIYHTLNLTNNKLIRGKTGANAPLFNVDLEPDLAESWESPDGGATFNFKLRKGVKTHNVPPLNGREFTSEDVLAGYGLYQAGGSQKDVFAPVDSMTAPDPYTVVFKLKEPMSDFPSTLASWGFVYMKELVDNEDLRQKQAMGTGPFIQKEWTKKERSVYDRHPDYFENGLPFVDEVIATAQDDLNTLRASFQTDHLFEWGPRDDADAKDMFKSRGDTMVSTKFPIARGANVNGFQFQMKNPTFQDDRVRHALSLAFDRNGFDQAYNAGDNENPEGPYSNSPMPWPYLFDSYPTAKANGQWYVYDAKQASQLMQAAGYTKDKPLKFTLESYYYATALSEVVVPGINQSLPETNITWKKVDNPTHVTLMSDRNFEEAIGFLWGPPAYPMDQWIYPFFHSTGSTNYGSINDATLDDLLVKQRKATDTATKKDLWMQIYNRIHDQVYQAWFPEARVRIAWQNYMLNYRYHAFMGSYVCYTSDQARAIWLDDGAPGVSRS